MLVISPHLDDAALSCAIRLLAGAVDEVVTVFTGSPSAETPLSDWDRLTRATRAAERVAERRREDEAAWASIGQRFRHLECVEARAGTLNCERLADDLRAAALGHDRVLLPAGIGGHPDHLAVREAALATLGTEVEITLYGELPYSAFYGWPGTELYLDVPAYWAEALTPLTLSHEISPPRLIPLSHHQRKAKIALVRHYRSQFPAVTGGSLDLTLRTGLFDYELEYEITRL